MERKLLIDFNNEEWEDKDWYEITDCVAETCGIQDAKVIAMKVEQDFGYNRIEAYTPEIETYYNITEDLYDWLDELVQGEDCKNGCQLYEDEKGVPYFCISGANFYDKDDNYAGTNEVRVYFKELSWQ